MKKLLDAGCGPGTINNLGYYKKFEKEYEIYGLDFIEKNIEIIRKRFPQGRFKTADIEKIPFPNGYFDCIIVRHVLEHVKNLEKTISEINRVAKDEATIIVSVPHERLEKAMSFLLPHYLDGGHHQRIFMKEKLERVFKKSSFALVAHSQQKWLMFIIVILLAFLSKLTNKIKMQDQTGIFLFSDNNYLKNKRCYPAYDFLYKVLTLSDKRLSFLNRLIPFEYEIIVRKT